jgi:hypothetical protein
MFVGLELRQSRDIAIAGIYQQRTELYVQMNSNLITSDTYLRGIEKFASQEQLTVPEQYVIELVFDSYLAYWENNHFQFQMGLMSAEQWNASLNAMRWSFQTYPETVEIWRRDRLLARKSFAEAVDALLDEIQTEN